MTEERSKSQSPLASGVTAAAAVAGWTVHDAAIYGFSAEPGIFWKLLPVSLLVGVVAAAIGALTSLSRWLALAWVGLCGLGVVLPRFWEPEINRVLFNLPKVALLLTLAAAAAIWVHRRWSWTGRGIPAVALGGLFAALYFSHRVSGAGAPGSTRWLSIAACIAAVAAILFFLGRVPRAAWRRAAVAALILAAAIPWWMQVRKTLTPPAPWRPEQRVAAPEGAPNLLLIVLDTVAAKHLKPYGYERQTTPGLDAFVESRATRFTNARSVTSWTLPAHGSLFTGLMPSVHGSTHQRVELPDDHPMKGFPALPLRKDVPTLAGIFTERGWSTGAVIGNSPFVSRKFGMHRGFEEFDDRDGAHLLPRLALAQMFGAHPGAGHVAYRRAETITDEALRWIDRRAEERPFFLFLNYMDAHYPYVPPAPFDRAFDEARPRDPLQFDPEDFSLLYDRELAYLDREVMRLLQRIEDDGLMDSTVVMITSDHGEIFGEHGLWFHNLTLYENVVRVPLYLAIPGGEADTDDRPVHSADMFHIALNSVGIQSAPEVPERLWTGEWYREDSLLKKLADPTPLQRDLIAWLDGDIKTIVGSNGKIERYDVASDPWEENDLAGELSGEVADEFRGIAEGWWKAHPPLAAAVTGPLDPETMERLRALGYVD